MKFGDRYVCQYLDTQDFSHSVSFLTQVERITGSSVAGSFKKLGEMESVPAPGPLQESGGNGECSWSPTGCLPRRARITVDRKFLSFKHKAS